MLFPLVLSSLSSIWDLKLSSPACRNCFPFSLNEKTTEYYTNPRSIQKNKDKNKSYSVRGRVVSKNLEMDQTDEQQNKYTPIVWSTDHWQTPVVVKCPVHSVTPVLLAGWEIHPPRHPYCALAWSFLAMNGLNPGQKMPTSLENPPRFSPIFKSPIHCQWSDSEKAFF